MNSGAVPQSFPQMCRVLGKKSTCDGIRVTTVTISSPEGAQAVGKPEGRYITLSLDGVQRRENEAFPHTVRAIAEELSPFLKDFGEKPVLVAGLGNRFITPDALGPDTHRSILVTRHLVEQMPEQFGYLRPVASLAAEVLGNTGIESAS